MPSMFISFSPIKRRHCSLFTTLRSSHTKKQLLEPPSKYCQQQFGQQQRTPLFQQFIVCSPLVCRSNILQREEDTLLPTSPLDDTDDDVSLVNIDYDIFENEHIPIDFMSSTLDLSGEQVCKASHHKGNDDEDHLMKEGRTGIRTRKRFQPSPEYDNVWEDITPPSAAAKVRHSDLKAKSKRSSEQISLEQSPLKTPTGSAGKLAHVQKEMNEVKKRKVTSFSSKPAVATTKHCSSQKNSNTKSNTPLDTPITPTDLDVLFGRGGRTNIHNAKFREEVSKFVDQYRQVTRLEKAIVATEVVNAVKGYGGRFLALDELGSWYEVDDTKARLKASQGEYTINCQYLFKMLCC